MNTFDSTADFQGNASGFGFSAVGLETLGSTEYTLVTMVLDKTGSVDKFKDELCKLKQTVAGACRKSPRADFLLLRVVEFNSGVDEVHGFMPLSQVDIPAYAVPKCGGLTALADAVFSAVSATNAYARALADQDYLVNGIVFVATDGVDNHSSTTSSDIRREISSALQGEHIESLRTVLIGINAAMFTNELQAFQAEAGIEQYVDMADATPQTLAKLADFVSRSISAQSQSLGTGGPSQALVF